MKKLVWAMVFIAAINIAVLYHFRGRENSSTDSNQTPSPTPFFGSPRPEAFAPTKHIAHTCQFEDDGSRIFHGEIEFSFTENIPSINTIEDRWDENRKIVVALDPSVNLYLLDLDLWDTVEPLSQQAWKHKNCTVPCEIRRYFIPQETDIIVDGHQKGMWNHPLKAMWRTEPHSKEPPEPKLEQYQFIMGWYKNVDVFLPPWILHDPLREEMLMWNDEHIPKYSWQQKKEWNKIAVFVADYTGGRRAEILPELMKYIKVDSTGKFLHNAELSQKVIHAKFPPWVKGNAFREKFYRKFFQMSEYMFYLAFENSEDPMWITEKFLGGFVSGTIPVILGWDGMKEYIPWRKSAIFINDFDSLEKLGEYLEYLSTHEDAYNEYFEWRKIPPSQLNPLFLNLLKGTRRRTMCFCSLCKLVAQYHLDPKVLGPRARRWNEEDKQFEYLQHY